jgi:hypothetical protein
LIRFLFYNVEKSEKAKNLGKDTSMKVLFLFGNAAVGKMTVGQELMKKTGLRLFHNHMTIEPTLEIFGDFNVEVIKRLREVIFDEFVKTILS